MGLQVLELVFNQLPQLHPQWVLKWQRMKMDVNDKQPNDLKKVNCNNQSVLEEMVRLIAPFAPLLPLIGTEDVKRGLAPLQRFPLCQLWSAIGVTGFGRGVVMAFGLCFYNIDHVIVFSQLHQLLSVQKQIFPLI